MGDADLDRRIAEAAAAVEALRNESHKLDVQIHERKGLTAKLVALIPEPCPNRGSTVSPVLRNPGLPPFLPVEACNVDPLVNKNGVLAEHVPLSLSPGTDTDSLEPALNTCTTASVVPLPSAEEGRQVPRTNFPKNMRSVANVCSAFHPSKFDQNSKQGVDDWVDDWCPEIPDELVVAAQTADLLPTAAEAQQAACALEQVLHGTPCRPSEQDVQEPVHTAMTKFEETHDAFLTAGRVKLASPVHALPCSPEGDNGGTSREVQGESEVGTATPSTSTTTSLDTVAVGQDHICKRALVGRAPRSQPDHVRRTPEFPSEAAVASMSRRERIALLEHESNDGNSSIASGADLRVGVGPPRTRHEHLEQPTTGEHTDDISSKGMSRRERIAFLEASGCGPEDGSHPSRARYVRRPNQSMSAEKPRVVVGSTGSHKGVTEQSESSTTNMVTGHEKQFSEPPRLPQESSLMRRRRAGAVVQEGRLPQHDYPSDEAVGHMSRRERIALLERADGDEQVPERGREPLRHESLQRESLHREDQPATVRTPSVQSSTWEKDDAVNDEAWLERRRQDRKMRLQRRPRVEPAPPPQEHVQPACASRNTAKKSEEDYLEDRGSIDIRQLLEELEDDAHDEICHSKLVVVCNSLKAGAHKLPLSGLVRAIKGVTHFCTRNEGKINEQEMIAFRCSAEALLGCITAQLASLDVGMVISALQTMVKAQIEEQTYLDMMLAQLLVLIRRDAKSFTPAVIACVAGLLGALHGGGLSAKCGSSGASLTANKRCLETLGALLTSEIDQIDADAIAQIGGSYLVSFMDDVQRRSILWRAADLQVGLCQGSCQHLMEMQNVERAVRQHSFAFIASLPDHTKDYLIKLKGTVVSRAP